MRDYRIRYSKTKNCLVTIQHGDFVYFGIARCNTKADNFNKKFGREIALNRAVKAVNYFQEMEIFDWSLLDTPMYSDTNLYGVLPVTEVRKLLRDFEIIDQICKSKVRL